MKNLFIIFLCCSAVLCFSANTKEDTKKQDTNLEKQEQILLKQEKQLAKEMFDTRVKLLQKNPELKQLYEKIMELHKELALQLDSRKEMRTLANKLRQVRSSIAEIKQQKEKKKEK